MECTCLAFYDDPESVTNAYAEYWRKRLEPNPRFMGFLLLQPDVHMVIWRSYKLFSFSTPEGKKNLVAFGVDASRHRNHFHATRRCPAPQSLLVVTLSTDRALDVLANQGILGFSKEIHVGSNLLVLSGVSF